jgi:alpha-1,2-mannosyltransferase
MDSPTDRPIYRYEKLGLSLLALTFVAFGGVVLLRSAFQQARKTDAGVYFRAAHAIRVGNDIYGLNTCDDNGWHYCYPPALAILLTPLADPFAWQERTGYIPYWVSVSLWYILSVVLLAWSLHQFARYALPDARPYGRKWWYARTVPFYFCIGGIGYTLARGQVNILLVALIAGAYAAAMRGHTVRLGFWLATAISLKVIPAYLLMFPLVRRDWKAIGGLVFGLLLWLILLPAAVFGWQGMIDNNLVFIDAVLAPGAIGTGDQTRAKELTNTTATDSQSFLAAMHNIRHPDFATRPANADKISKLFHLGMAALLTLSMFGLAVVRGIKREAPEQLIFLGCLTISMLHITPVSHVHYYALGLPLVAGLWLRGLRDRPDRLTANRTTMLLLFTWGIMTTAVLFPYEITVVMREYGAGPLASVLLWSYGLRVCGK